MHALSLESSRTMANVSDLEALIGSISFNLSGTGNLSSRAKRTYYWFAELAARGFVSVRAPMGAHAHLQWLSFGQTKSISTFRRSVAELERAGYINRRNCRRGDVATIDIDLDKFKFYIQQNRRFKPLPCGTFEHHSVHQSSCPPDEFTSNYVVSKKHRSHVVTTSLLSKKSAKKTKTGFADWIHPIVFSIGVVCYSLGRRERERLQQAALSAIADKMEPFDYWTAERWQAMSIPVRENTARELLPELKGIAERYEKNRADRRERIKSEIAAKKSNPPPEIEMLTELDDSQLNPWFAEFSKRMAAKLDLPSKINPAPPPIVEKESEKVECSLTKEEREQAKWAMKNMKVPAR